MTTLEKAFESLRSLPHDMQEELAEHLLSYVTQWKALKAGIDQGTRELDRGEGIEINDIKAFIGNLETKHGSS